MWKVLMGALLGCTGLQRPEPVLDIEYRPGDGVVRVYNRTGTPIRIYYGDVRQPDDNAMIFARFRDRRSRILDVGNPGGWFSPNIYSSQIYLDHMYRSVVIPAGSFTDRRWDLTRFAGAVNRPASEFRGPCEVQIGLFGYLENDDSRRIEAWTGWMRGPCPGYARNRAR